MERKMSENNKIILELMYLSRLYRKNIEKSLSKKGCHHSQQRILFYLLRSKNKVSQKEIADFFLISPACVAVTIKKMEKNNLVRKAISENDSRVNLIEITEKGKSLLRESVDEVTNIDNIVFNNFKNEEKEVFIEYIRRIKENLKNMEYEVED